MNTNNTSKAQAETLGITNEHKRWQVKKTLRLGTNHNEAGIKMHLIIKDHNKYQLTTNNYNTIKIH